MKKIEALNTEVSEMEQQVKEVEERNHSLRMKKKEAMQELEALQAQVEASQTECRQLLKEQEVNREGEAEFIGSRYKLLKPQPQSKMDPVMRALERKKCDFYLHTYVKMELQYLIWCFGIAREAFHTCHCVFFIARGILEMKLQNIMCDRKHLYESQSVQLREKNRYRMMSN